MKIQELKEILQGAYSREKWIKTLQFLSGNKNLLSISLDPKQEIIKSAKAKEIVFDIIRLGTLKTIDGISLPIFDITLQDGIKIEYNRVGVNDLLKKHILKDAIKGAIVTFHYQEGYNRKEWRFSFISKFGGSDYFAELESVETNPKKYTYIFGTPEEHRTALERLYNLEQSRFRLEDFFEAFNVEPVSNNFFKEYKNFYQDFVFELSNNEQSRAIFNKEGITKDDLEKDIRNFVKRLLGRLVFLYFLQKKRWLGASNEKYDDGDTNFLFNLFNYNEESRVHFYKKWLSPLFFNALNTPNRPNDGFELAHGNSVWIPFLNGGLFEENQEPEKHREIQFPPTLFELLFKFFNGYNFTIYENSPEDHTIAVDPEMLGHIFENLLEDNKDKGAFYTPKEIVHYMTQESLIEYLKTHLSHSREAIENLIKNHITEGFTRDDLKEVEDKIDQVKICDPAIGSGAFPMGLLQEIFGLKALIHYELGYNVWSPAKIKQDIIQNSIYGVDIEEGAVDIARLRFWLSLVVDEPTPKPLPNLDYKIMQGNSLLESYEGIDLSKVSYGDNLMIVENQDKDLFGNLKDDQLKITYGKSGLSEKIQRLVAEYFTAYVEKKHKIKSEINAAIKEHIDYNLELRENQLVRLIKDIRSIKTPNNKEQKALAKLESDLTNLIEIKANIEAIQTKDEKPYFLWHLFFGDVFKNGGFDIVIGNPPYVNIYSINKNQKEYFSENYTTAHKKYDLYVLFFEKSIALAKQKGIISLITSNKYFSQPYGFKLRELLLKFEFNHIVNFRFNIFNATVDTAITSIKKINSAGILRFKDINNKSDYESLFDRKYNTIDIEFVKSEKEKNFRLEVSDNDTVVLNEILQKSIPLNEICYVNYGCRLVSKDRSKKKSDYIFEEKASENYKDFIEGRNIKKYVISKPKYLNYQPKEHYLALFPELFESKKIVSKDVVGKDGLQLAYDSIGLYNDHTVINAIKWSDLLNVAYRNVKREIQLKDIERAKEYSYEYLLGILNSKLSNFYFIKKHNIDLHFYPGVLQAMPIFKNNNRWIEGLSSIVIYMNKLKNPLSELVTNEHISSFFEEVIDGYVFELYFEDHMKDKGINIIDDVTNYLEKSGLTKDFENLNDDTKKQKVWELYKEMSTGIVQVKMTDFVTKSPDILKPILQS